MEIRGGGALGFVTRRTYVSTGYYGKGAIDRPCSTPIHLPSLPIPTSYIIPLTDFLLPPSPLTATYLFLIPHFLIPIPPAVRSLPSHSLSSIAILPIPSLSTFTSPPLRLPNPWQKQQRENTWWRSNGTAQSASSSPSSSFCCLRNLHEYQLASAGCVLPAAGKE